MLGEAGPPSGGVGFHPAVSGPMYFPVVLACPAYEKKSSLRGGSRANDRDRKVRFRDSPSVSYVEVSDDMIPTPTGP